MKRKNPELTRRPQAHRSFWKPPHWPGARVGFRLCRHSPVLPAAAPSSRAGLPRSVWPPPRVECRVASWQRQRPGLESRAPGLRGQHVGGSSVAARPATPSQRCRRGGVYDASFPRAWEPRWAISAWSLSGGRDIWPRSLSRWPRVPGQPPPGGRRGQLLKAVPVRPLVVGPSPVGPSDQTGRRRRTAPALGQRRGGGGGGLEGKRSCAREPLGSCCLSSLLSGIVVSPVSPRLAWSD